MSITYQTLAFYQAGSPKTGLSPSISVVYNLETLSAVTIAASDIVIVELGQGMYRLAINWAATSLSLTRQLSIRIDGDPGAIIGLTDSERYQFFEVSRNDIVKMEDFYDALTGDWEILNNQLIMKDRDGNTLHTFNLFDSYGQATSSNPIKREHI